MAGFVPGTPCWVDAALPDVAAGKRFYGALFGWTFTDRGGEPLPGGGTRGRWADAYSDGRLVAALTPKRDGRMPTVWGVYLATEDARSTARLITASGGQVINDPLPAGTEAVTAVVADPGGAVFGLWQAAEREGFEKHGDPGSYCWTEVYTRAKERVDAFYEGVFGFQGTDLHGLGSEDFRMWSPAGTEPGESSAVGGRSVIDDSLPAEMPGHFLVYFRVEDCDAAAETVARLGGRVRTAPYDIPYGRMAVFADDQGAQFAVLAEAAAPSGGGGTGAASDDEGWPHDAPGPVPAPDAPPGHEPSEPAPAPEPLPGPDRTTQAPELPPGPDRTDPAAEPGRPAGGRGESPGSARAEDTEQQPPGNGHSEVPVGRAEPDDEGGGSAGSAGSGRPAEGAGSPSGKPDRADDPHEPEEPGRPAGGRGESAGSAGPAGSAPAPEEPPAEPGPGKPDDDGDGDEPGGSPRSAGPASGEPGGGDGGPDRPDGDDAPARRG